MDQEFISWLISQTGTGALAAFSIYLLNQARKDAQQLISNHASTQRDDKLILSKVVEDNARATATLSTKLDGIVALIHKSEEILHEERVRQARGS